MSFLSSLRGRIFGEKAAAPPAPSAEPVVDTLPLHQQFQRIGGNKSPQTVSNIIREADSGRPSRLVDLSRDARQIDGHLHSCLFTREIAVAMLDLIIEAYQERDEKEPSTRNRDIAYFVQDALIGACGDAEKETVGLTDTVANLQQGVYLGYAVNEIDWIRDGRYLVPGGFWSIDQRRFEFRQSDGRLVQSDVWGGPAAGVDLMSTYPGQIIQHQPRINGDVPAREGLNKLLVWPATFRNWTVADWLALAELSWKPWRIGKYSEKAGEADRAKLREALIYLTTNGVALVRKDHELDIKWPEGQRGTRSSHQALAEWLGAEISKAVLGQTLTTEQGERGARSLGEVHDRVRLDIREYDARSVAATLLRDLVRWIVRFNFGADVPLPKVYFNTDDAPALETFSAGLKNLTEAQLRVPAKWARGEMGIPEPEEGEELLGDWEDVDTEELDEAA